MNPIDVVRRALEEALRVDLTEEQKHQMMATVHATPSLSVMANVRVGRVVDLGDGISIDFGACTWVPGTLDGMGDNEPDATEEG